MKKIPCLFERIFQRKGPPILTDRVTPGCAWALDGEGQATVKWDGTACLVLNGKLYKRFDSRVDKAGQRKPLPDGAIPCDPEPDPVTGHWPHWVLVDPSKPEDRWYAQTWSALSAPLADGTYELCGPAINGNPQGLAEHAFIKHGAESVSLSGLTFDAIREFLQNLNREGIVFHHPDGRLCKIRRDDYGLPWPIK